MYCKYISNKIYFHEDSTIYINLKNKFKINRDIIYNLIKIGVPASLEQIAMRVGILLFKNVASLGTVAYATHQISINILNLSFTPGQAFGIAASTLAGRSLEREIQNWQKNILEPVVSRALASATMAILFFFFGRNCQLI